MSPTSAERGRLLADLVRRGSVSARLEVVALRDADGLDPLVEVSTGVREAVEEALRAAALGHDARFYRLGDSTVAFLGAAGPRRQQSPASSVREALAALSRDLADAVVVGEALLPDDTEDGSSALDVAMRRLRARSRLTPRSAERQVRDALLQTLAECRTVSSAVDVPQVAAATVATGRSVGMDLGQLDVLVRAAELQDIGKLAIPDEILGKRGELSPGEWDVVRQHPVVAERILSAASALAPVARIVRSCAERYDGTGYPDGLSGDAIPHGARIIAVCVAFDAMTSLRPYRPALAPAAALVELIRCAGAQFDPTVVASFAATLDF